MKTLKEYIDSGELDGKILTLNVIDKDNNIYISKTIMNVNFKDDVIRKDLIVIDENCCGNMIFMSKSVLGNYFIHCQKNDIHYIFNTLVQKEV